MSWPIWRKTVEEIAELPELPDDSKGYPPDAAEFPMEATDFWVIDTYAKITQRSEHRGLGQVMSKDDIIGLAKRSGGRCELTGLPFAFGKWRSAKRNPMFPSVDRIDSMKGYTFDNCRLVLLCVNFAMNEWGADVFDLMARAYVHRDASVAERAAAARERARDEKLNRKIDAVLARVRCGLHSVCK